MKPLFMPGEMAKVRRHVPTVGDRPAVLRGEILPVRHIEQYGRAWRYGLAKDGLIYWFYGEDLLASLARLEDE